MPAACSPDRRMPPVSQSSGGILSHLFGLCTASEGIEVKSADSSVMETRGQRNWMVAGRQLTWRHSSEVFSLCGETEKMPGVGVIMPVLRRRLFFMISDSIPTTTAGVHFFTTDNKLVYVPFCDDFGPYNLAMMHEFCDLLQALLLSNAHGE